MRAFVLYGAASAVLLIGMAGLVVALVGGAEPGAVWWAAGVAWPVQLAAFGALVVGRDGIGFMAAWAGGMAVRFAVVGAAAVLVTRLDGPDPASLLLSLIGFVFVLVLMEPLFLRLTN